MVSLDDAAILHREALAEFDLAGHCSVPVTAVNSRETQGHLRPGPGARRCFVTQLRSRYGASVPRVCR